MAKESHAEKKAVSAKEKQFKGKPNRKELGPKSEMPSGMSAPSAPGESHKQMDGDSKSDGGMSRAVKHLEHQTERGKHCATVGPHTVSSHSGGYDGE